jgi:hypothetical protein
MATWLYEIYYIIGWNGTEWLDIFHYSPIFIAFLMTISFLFPLYIKDQKKWKILIKPLLILVLMNWIFYILSWIVFYISIWVFYFSLYDLFRSFYELFTIIGISVTWGLFSYLGCFLYKIIGNRLGIINFNRRIFFTFYLLVFSIMPLSILSVIFYTIHDAFVHWYTLPADAVKMGYPIFWIGVVLGLFSTFHTFYYSPRKRTSKE